MTFWFYVGLSQVVCKLWHYNLPIRSVSLWRTMRGFLSNVASEEVDGKIEAGRIEERVATTVVEKVVTGMKATEGKVVIFVADVKEVETVEIEETEERGEFHSGIGVKPMEKPGISSSIMNNFFDKTKYFYK